MINPIPNPKKILQIEKNIEDVKSAIEHISLFTAKYKLHKIKSVLNLITYEVSEILSVRVFIDITYSKIDENRTQVIIEIKRKVGNFSLNDEITTANNHLINLSELFSESIRRTKKEREALFRKIEIENLNEENLNRNQSKKAMPPILNQQTTLNHPKLTLFLLATIVIIIGVFLLMIIIIRNEI